MEKPESAPVQPVYPTGNDPTSKRNKIWTIVKIVVSTTLLILLFTQVKWQRFFEILASVSLIYMLYPLIGYYFNMALSVFKWQALLGYLGIKDRFAKLYAIYLTGAFYNNFLPSTIGGDGYRFLEMSVKHPGKPGEIFSSILLERGFGYLMLLLVNCVLALYFWDLVVSQTWLLLIQTALAVGLMLVVLLWLFRYRLAARIATTLHRVKVLGKLDQFLHMLDSMDTRVLLISLGTSFLFVIIGGIWLGVYYWSVGAEVNWLYAIYVSTLVNIIGAIPITLNGLGVVELLQARLMGLVGVPVETVLVVSLLTRVVLLILSLPGGFLSFRWK